MFSCVLDISRDGGSLFTGVSLPLSLPLPLRIMGFMGFFNWSNFPLTKWHKALKTLCASACNKIKLLFIFCLAFVFPPSFLSNQITVDQSALPGRRGAGEGRREGGKKTVWSYCQAVLAFSEHKAEEQKTEKINSIFFLQHAEERQRD